MIKMLAHSKYFFLLILLSLGVVAHSCINEYRVLMSGKLIYTDAGNAAPRGRFDIDDKSYLYEKLDEAERAYRSSGSTEDYSDLGAMLVYTRQYEKAKAIFIEIEKTSPGLYATASNLGTVYELLGMNDSAYFWIKRGIELNPGSHKGSEWIHLKILEAKLKAKGDENYLWIHSILNLNFGNEKIPENINKLNLQTLSSHLYHQLNERMSFIKPKDPIVAQLLFDLGNVAALESDASSGFQVYEAAKTYGYSSELFDKRYSYFKKLQFRADFRNRTEGFAKQNPILTLMMMGAAFVLFISLIIIFVRRRRRKKLMRAA